VVIAWRLVIFYYAVSLAMPSEKVAQAVRFEEKTEEQNTDLRTAQKRRVLGSSTPRRAS
jgi:hypothetical protein